MGNIDSPFSAVIVLNILLLEDRDEDALMVERALKDTGYIYSLKRARNKAEFIAQLDAGFDLILADYHLADCNALEALRQLEERKLDIPFILVSGVAREEEANEAIRHGAADYLSRDRLSRLGPAIAAAFEHKALRVEADDVERALERSREEFDHAFDNAAIGIALTSLDGRWLKVNEALCRVTGYAEPELLATDCHSVTHVDDVAGDVDLMRRLVGGEVGSTQREKRYIHKLGHPVWVQVTASLVRGRDGAARYRMLQVLDITHRKEAEERFQATFNQAAVGIAHTTTEGAILEVNRKLCDMLGFTAQELMRLTTRELTFAGDRDKQDSLRRQVIAGQLPHFQAEKRFVRKNGQVIWVNRTVTLARHAASGEPYLIQVFEDITERRRTEERLERANRARRVLAECSRALVHASSESELLQQMCRIIVESGGYKQGWIGFATGDPTRPLCPVAQAGYAGDEPFPSPETLTANGTYRGVAAEALASGAPVVAKDILNDPRHEWRRARALRHGFQSSIGLPLKAEDSVLGVLVMHASEPDAFDDEEIALLTTLSEDIAFGIGSSRAAAARRQAEANLNRLIRARRVMAECSHIVVHATDEMVMLESLCRVVVESGGYRQSWIGLPTRDSMRPVYPVADSGFGSDAPMTAPVTWTSGSYHGLAAEALAAGETRIARDILNDPQHERKRDRARQLGYQCSIALPLKGEKEVLGVIVIHAAEPEAFDSDEIALLTELADDIAYAIVGLRTRLARRNAEAALRESEERFRVLTELSSDWSWEQDADYRFTSLSQSVKSHAGISAEDHVGRARWELPRTSPVNTTWDEHKAVLAARQLFHDLLLRRVLEDGSEHYVLVSGQPVFDASGTFKGYRGVAKNITDKITAEMALRESERRFREMFDQAAVGITRVHLDGVLVDVNQKFCNMLGYAKDELLGRPIREITHPDDYAQGLQYRERVTRGTAKSVTGEKRFVRKDGTILWARRTMSAACDDAGDPQYVISVVEDITERKEAEERYWATFEHAPVGIMHTDMDNDRILHANPKLREMLGYTQQELIGLTTDQILHPDHVGGDRPKYRDKMLKGELDSFSSERRYMRKDGSPVWVNRTVSLVRDAAGKPQYFIRIVEDISERKRAEEAVARERSLLRTIIDTLPDYIYVKDRAGRFRLANEAWLKARRITAEDIAGKTVFDMFPREVAERMAAQDEAIVKTGAPLLDFEQLIIVKTPDGEQSETQWASTTKVPMRDSSGDIIGTVGISRDITERRLSTRRRTMEHGVTRVLADSATLNEALPAILQNICEALGWACGAYWQWDEKAEILRCVETWHVDGEEVAAFSAFSKQDVNEAPAWRDGAPKTETGGLVRGVWFSGAPVWLPDVAQQPGFRRGPMAAKAGLHCAFGFPVRAGSRPLGVMEFYGRDIKQPDEALLQIVRSIGSQIGQFDQRKQAEEAQRASEATLSATFEQAGVGMALRGIDPRNPRWLRVNQKLCDILGYTREELLQLSSVDVTPPEERRLAIDYNERLLRGEVASYSREKRYLRKDGQIIWATISLSAVRGPGGAPTHVISVIQDITDRKRAEAALQESEEHLRGMFAHASVGITVSALDLHYIDVNDKYCDIVGYSREELLKMSVRDVNVSENLASMEEHRRKLFAGEIESMVREKQLLRKDGSQVWVSMVTSVIRDHTGGPKHFISVIQDVSQRKRAEEALRESEEQFRQLAGNIPQVFWITDVERKQTIYVSSAAEKLIGRPLEEIQANPRMLIRAVHKADRPRLNAARKAAAEGGYEVTYRIVRPGGAIRWVHDRAFPVHDADGNVYRIAGITEDITERRRADEALQESEEQFRQLANNIPQVFWITDAEQKDLVYLSPAYEVVSGQSIEQVKPDPRKWLEIVHQDDRDRVAQARKRAADAQYDEMFRIVRPDGSIRWMRDRAFPVRDAEGFVYRIAGIAEDITERKAAEERLMHLAHYDVLTSLPNRVLFYDRLRQALAQAKRNQWIVGVMFMDVDRFKNVNDTLGHAVGDKLLQQISDRLARSVRSGDTVGRLGGDEFAIVLSNLSSAQDANLVAQKMMAGFNEPFKLEGAELYMTASIGITLYPDDSTDQDTLIKNADTAMYRSKEVGRNSYQFYTPEMNARALQVLGMESSLRRALERNEFLLYYQPKAGIADGDITGVEALLRWRHPERGLVSPGEFMQVLEETGLIVPVGEWVLKAVCSQIKAWELAGITPLPVAVNLSARQFSSKDLGASIKRIIEEHRVDPGLIELELTESSLMTNTEEAVRTLEYLSSLGVSLAIDDFGTGYSSLGYLKRFPLDALKVDRSFVRDITTDGDDATITRAVISMAHSLGLKVVAEGVETESQLAFLAEYGCDQIQGYYFSPPIAAEECSTWLKEKRCLRRPVGVADSGSPVVLLVDDDDDALTLVKRVLAKDGYRILAARNAQEGLALLRDHRVDVVISDHNMPGTPGVEFLQRVKALSPRTMRMMTSGYADFQTLAEAVNKGEIFRFLPKNISGEALRADVREALRTRAEALSNNGHYIAPGTVGK